MTLPSPLLRIAAATALGTCAAAAAAQGSVTLSGVIDAAVRSVRNDGAGRLQSLISGGNATSRLVVRGSEDLGAGWSAGFHLEHGIALDTGAATSASQFWDRRATLSLASRERLHNLGYQTATGGETGLQVDAVLRQLERQASEERTLPGTLTLRARRLLERGRDLLVRLKALGEYIEACFATAEQDSNSSDPLTPFFRDTAAMTDAALRMVQTLKPGRRRTSAMGIATSSGWGRRRFCLPQREAT